MLNPDLKSGFKLMLRLTSVLSKSFKLYLKPFAKTKVLDLSLKLYDSIITENENIRHFVVILLCLQCFDAVGWVVICLERGAVLHMAQLMPLPLTVFCFSKIQIGFTFLVPAHLGSPGKRAVKRVCVCSL